MAPGVASGVPVDNIAKLRNFGNENDMIRQGQFLSHCKFGATDYSLEEPTSGRTARNRDQLKRRYTSYTTLFPDTIWDIAQFENAQIIFHGVGIDQFYNGSNDRLRVYNPSELPTLKFDAKREIRADGEQTTNNVFKKQLFYYQTVLSML